MYAASITAAYTLRRLRLFGTAHVHGQVLPHITQEPDPAADLKLCHGWLQRPHNDTCEEGRPCMVG